MARKSRVHFPGALYHVMQRGNAGQNIFYNDRDRQRYLQLLQDGINRFGHSIHTFCLMNNHVHIALQVGEIPLSRIMQHMGQNYTTWINRRKKRSGHVFQGRYQAILVDAEKYLLGLVRYIHFNPVRAGTVKHLDEYRWSGHRTYMGKDLMPWLTVDVVLARFARSKKMARRGYVGFISDKLDRPGEFYDHEGNANIDDTEFDDPKCGPCSGIVVRREVTLEEVIGKVCELYGLTREEMAAKGKKSMPAKARGVVSWFVRETEHLSLTELSRHFGRDLSSLSEMAGRVAERSRRDKILMTNMAKLEKELL